MTLSKTRLEPLEYRVIVLPDPVDDKAGEAGLLYKPETAKTQDKRAQTNGTIVALSKVAFKRDWDGQKPAIGDKVVYGKYCGQYYTEDKVEYVIMNDQDIVGILKEKV